MVLPGLPSTGNVPGDPDHAPDHDTIVIALGLVMGQQVAPSGATYNAAMGDIAALTLGTTTSAILPIPSTMGIGVVMACVAGTGSVTVTVADSSDIIGPNGAVDSFPMAAVGTIFAFQVIGGTWTAR